MTRPFDVENNLVTVTKAYDMGLADGIAETLAQVNEDFQEYLSEQ